MKPQKSKIIVDREPQRNPAMSTSKADGYSPDVFQPSAADTLAFLQSTMEPAAGKWLESVVRFAGSIPASSGNILEIHFEKNQNSVDFATRLNADFDQEMIAASKRQDDILSRMPGIVTSLIDQQGTGFMSGIKNIWIEYDAPFSNPPAVFFDIDRDKSFDPQAVYTRLEQIGGAAGYHMNGGLLKFLEHIKQTGLYVVYYGLMFSRTSFSIRLTVNGITSETITNALGSLGWKGSYQLLEKIKSTYLCKEQTLVVGIDFGDCLENRIGIEVFNDNHASFIRKLHINGLLCPVHVELLNAWKGSFMMQEGLGRSLADLHRRPVSKCYTRLNHFKFVVDDTDKFKVKGYLYYCF